PLADRGRRHVKSIALLISSSKHESACPSHTPPQPTRHRLQSSTPLLAHTFSDAASEGAAGWSDFILRSQIRLRTSDGEELLRWSAKRLAARCATEWRAVVEDGGKR